MKKSEEKIEKLEHVRVLKIEFDMPERKVFHVRSHAVHGNTLTFSSCYTESFGSAVVSEINNRYLQIFGRAVVFFVYNN